MFMNPLTRTEGGVYTPYMSWFTVNIILYVAAFSVGSMNLCLAILFHLRKDYDWTKYYLVFQLMITFLLLVFGLRGFTGELNGGLSPLFNLVTLWLLYLSVAFLVYFIPYFTTWVIAHPWRDPYRTVFAVLGVGFLALAVLGSIYSFSLLVRSLMGLIFFGDFIFCLGVIIKNLRAIRSRDVRLICRAFIILSAFMIPFLVVDLFLSFERLSTIPIYYFWSSLIILVYLFNYVRTIPESAGNSIDEKKIEEYHITDREREIILLIQQGLISKEIAGELKISTSTVNNHISNIYHKTHVSSRIDLLNELMC